CDHASQCSKLLVVPAGLLLETSMVALQHRHVRVALDVPDHALQLSCSSPHHLELIAKALALGPRRVRDLHEASVLLASGAEGLVHIRGELVGMVLLGEPSSNGDAIGPCD